MRPNEVMTTIVIPRPGKPGAELTRKVDFLKVSKRRELYISIVAGAFCVDVDAAGVVRQARIAYGGVAERSKRAMKAETAAIGRTLAESKADVLAALRSEFTPIDDARGTASYRRSLVTGLWESFVAGEAGQTAPGSFDFVGVGFNDPTPALPVGGNIGVTVGEQRLIAYRYALDLWGARLDSDPTIVVQGSFAGLPCNAGGGVLAQAGALQIFSDFDNAPMPATWYGAALANAIAGEDFYAVEIGIPPGQPDPGQFAPPFNDEIIANFNGNVGQPNCIAGPGWYYGLDNNPGPGQIDFLNTFMHEVGHGLGFQNFMDDATGELAGDQQDIYTIFSYDNTTGQTHAEMATDEERQASVINTGNVVWIGATVTAEAPNVLSDRQFMEIYAPASIAGEIDFTFANFGPEPTPTNQSTATEDRSNPTGS
jgi:hypothetical protein